mgnify:CR=1 FL=1
MVGALRKLYERAARLFYEAAMHGGWKLYALSYALALIFVALGYALGVAVEWLLTSAGTPGSLILGALLGFPIGLVAGALIERWKTCSYMLGKKRRGV